MKRLIIFAITGLALAGCQSSDSGSGSSMASMTPMASAPTVSDLVDARAAGGESEMMARGFTAARTQGLTTYWWHAPSATCVATRTSQGRYQSVTTVAASDCGM